MAAINHIPAVGSEGRVMYSVVAVGESNWFIAMEGHDLKGYEERRFI